MEKVNQQALFFQELKLSSPFNISFVDTIADILKISPDSAYRRIRGEKPLEFDEIHTLCSRFNISFDRFMSIKNNSFIFNGDLPLESSYKLSNWLESMLNFFELINSYEKVHFNWFVRDFPVFLLFQIPELSAFKFFFWTKSILGDKSLENKKFSIQDINIDEKNMELGRKVGQLFNSTPGSEIWNVENISATLRQLEYYKQMKVIQSSTDYKILYDKLEQIVSHVESQAEFGKKFMFGGKPDYKSVEYCLYKNDLILGDGTSITEINETKITWIIHGFINIITTADERFNEYTFESIKNLKRKSTQISVIGEMERKLFFNSLRNRIELSKQN